MMAVTLASGCGSAQSCRPGTVFVTTSIGADAESADTIDVTVKRTGLPDATVTFHRAAGIRTESVELVFKTYVAGQAITLVVTAKAGGQIIATGMRPLTLLTGCSAFDVPITSVAPGADFAMTPMPDMTQPPPPDLRGFDGYIDLAPPPDLTPPPGAPDAPTNVVSVAKPGGKFTLTWTAPANSGAGPITGYIITSNPPGLSDTSSTTTYNSPMLTIGTNYTFDVQARNAFVVGPAGTSNAAVCGDVPGVPPSLQATAPSGRAVLTWMPAAANGYPITGYVVTLTPGAMTQSLPATATSATFTGLTSGNQYSFTIYATNGMGNGASGNAGPVTANCANNTYTLYALDSCSVEYNPPPQLSSPDALMEATRDTRLYNIDLRGWAKFSLGTVPTWAKITSIVLTLTAQQVNIGNTPTPVVEIWYSADDGWNRAMIPTANDIHATTVVSGQYPSGVVGKQNFTLNVGARDWSGDVADRYLTLGIRNVNTNWSSNLYASSDNNPAGSSPYITLGTCE
jgi:Fibronectin type III domain